MSLMRFKLSARLVARLTLVVFAQLVFQPFPDTIAARRDLVHAARQCSGLARQCIVNKAKSTTQIKIRVERRSTKQQGTIEVLSKLGPVFADYFSMSKFAVDGFVKGGWPLVIDYELEANSVAQITIATNGVKSFVMTLPPTNERHAQVIRQLPVEFGEKPLVGRVSFEALRNGSDQPAHFFLYGLGFGPNAVGSMVIDQLMFQPANIHPKLKEKASYSFHSRSDFDTVSVEFRQPILLHGIVTSKLAAGETLKKGVRPNETVTNSWDGNDTKGKPSLGPHQFFVRAWRGQKSGADWVFAADGQVVTVE